MSLTVRFELPGPPQPKQRARVTSRGTFTPAATRRYEKSVGQTAAAALHLWRMDSHTDWPLDGEYRLSCVFHLPGYRLADADNLGKAVSDGIEGVLYTNDRQVGQVTLLRVYGSERPRTEVELTWIGPRPVRAKAARKRKAVA